MSFLEKRLPPPLLAVAIAAAMSAVAYFGPPSPVPWPARAAAAAVLFLLAGSFGPRAIRAFGRAKTTIDPLRVDRASSLVTTGVYARTRNPMYVALALLLASLAAWLGLWAPLLGPVVFVLYMTRFQILPEERALTARFGDDYARYRSAVRRWL